MPFPSIPQRWIVCTLLSWAFGIMSFKNSCFYEIADIVYSVSESKTKPTGSCPFCYSENFWELRTLPFSLPDVYWNPSILDIADSAFHTGILLTVIPAGILSDIGYSKLVLGGGMFLIGVKHLLFPVTCHWGVFVYAVENFFEGIGEASLPPSIFSLISRWTPPSERNTLTAVIVAGMFYGEFLGRVFFKLIYLGLSSWSFGQYLTGTLGILWVLLCSLFIYHSPDESPFVSQREFHTITENRRRQSLLLKLLKLQGIPWRKIISSRAFVSLVLVYCSLEWAIPLNIFPNLGSYQFLILHLPYKFSNNSTLAIICVLPTLLMGGFLADWMINHAVASRTAIKRMFAGISVVGSSVLLVTACCLVGCNVTMFWVLTMAAIYTLGLALSPVYSTPVDISPRHAGVLMAIMFGIKTIFSLFDPKIDDLFLRDQPYPIHWRVRCLFWAAVTVTMAVPFLFWGSGEKQRWRSSVRASHLDFPPPPQLEPIDEPADPQSTR